MSWVYVSDLLTEEMRGTCTCMHLHAPASTVGDVREDSKERKVAPKKENVVVVSSHKPLTKTYRYKTLQLKDLPSDSEWWAARVAQHPGVDLTEELSKALDWPRADRVKNAKLFFRNWLAKAPVTKTVELTPDQIRERLRVVS